jgi:AcrR family transcriptional regulator
VKGRSTVVRHRSGRPAVAGAARQAIVDAADTLFYQRGVAAVSIDAIARRAGVTRRTLYYHFSGKDQLVVEHVRLRDRAIREQARESSIEEAFGALDRLFCKDDFHGCAITNVMIGGAATPRIVGRMTERHKAEMERWFVAQGRALGARRPEDLGRMLMLLYEGALIAARVRRNADTARLACEAAATLLRAHGIETRAKE